MADSTKQPKVNDTVNHPKHYNRENGMECIDEMILVFGKEAVKHFCLCNAWKYRYRAADKNGEEDLKKSDWYLQKYKELCEKDTSSTCTVINTPYVPSTISSTIPNMPWYYNDSITTGKIN